MSDIKRNFTVPLTDAEAHLIWRAAGYSRMRPEEFIVAAARHTIAKGDENRAAIRKAREEEEKLLGIKRID